MVELKRHTPPNKKASILIVDDSPPNIRILMNLLKNEYDIMAATSGTEAIDVTFRHLPDLILLDISMPEMDGYEVCRRLKADPRASDIPIIFITAITSEEGETAGFKVGAVDYIRKPFSPIIVKARIRNQLELKQHRDHLEELNRLLKQEIAERTRTEEALKHLLKKQEINIDTAKSILTLINGIPPRYIDLPNNLKLFADTISAPCYAEGGDHFFIRTLPFPCRTDNPTKPNKTIVSLKDQSGHEVGCVLRSIVTDLTHQMMLTHETSPTLSDTISKLNQRLCQLSIFSEDNFFTLIDAELDHETLMLSVVSGGHPPFILIRGTEVKAVPEIGTDGTNMPVAVFDGLRYSEMNIPLQPTDRLIFYTDGLIEMPLKNTHKTITIIELLHLVQEIIQKTPDMPVSDLMHHLLQSVAAISREEVIPDIKNTSEDDVTLIGLEIEDWNTCHEEVWTPRESDDILSNINKLYLRLKHEWDIRGYESPETRMRAVAEEAIVNAWIHGNRQNINKTLTVRWRFGNDFHLEVIDEGEGFDPDIVPDPRCEENLTKPCGRGVFIIRHFCDSVHWKNNGRHIVMMFKKHDRKSLYKERVS